MSAVIYAGKHYGRLHRILFISGRFITAIHDESGDVIDCHLCDCEVLP